MLEVRDLRIRHFLSDRATIDGLNLTVGAGERILLIGPSGSGKSTLLHAIGGVIQGLDVAQVTGEITSAATALLLQNPEDTVVAESVLQELGFYASGFESAGRLDEAILTALEDVGLTPESLAKRPEHHSGGELQRIALAACLMQRPQLLLLDEPTSHLDEASAKTVREAVVRFLDASGAAAIIAEHHFEGWLPFVTRVLVLDSNGSVLADGPWAAVLSECGEQMQQLGLWIKQPAIEQTAGSYENLSVVIGPSGSGKTTELLRQLDVVNGQKVAWLPQNPSMALSGKTVSACVTNGVSLSEAQEWLSALGIEHLAQSNPFELSGGEQRRVALAAALASKPEVLFVDEPTAGLDTTAWTSTIQALVRALNEGTRVVAATHDPVLIEMAGSQVSAKPGSKPVADNVGSGISPLATIGVSLLLFGGALAFTNLVSTLLALAFEVAILGLYFASRRTRFKVGLLIPLIIGIASVGFSNWWLSSSHSLDAALLVAARTAFFGVPSLLLAGQISTSWMGEQLTEVLKMPQRPVVAAMVGFNRASRLGADWKTTAKVRKIRGTASKGLAEFPHLLFLSLLSASRSATTTSMAMEARGFSGRKTEALPSRYPRWGRHDLTILVIAVALILVGLVA